MVIRHRGVGVMSRQRAQYLRRAIPRLRTRDRRCPSCRRGELITDQIDVSTVLDVAHGRRPTLPGRTRCDRCGYDATGAPVPAPVLALPHDFPVWEAVKIQGNIGDGYKVEFKDPPARRFAQPRGIWGALVRYKRWVDRIWAG